MYKVGTAGALRGAEDWKRAERIRWFSLEEKRQEGGETKKREREGGELANGTKQRIDKEEKKWAHAMLARRSAS